MKDFMLTTEDLFKMSFKTDMYTRSEEVYFSKETSLERALINLVSDLRTLYNDYFKVDYSIITTDNRQYALIIEKAIKKYEVEIGKAINAESVTIGLTFKANASAYPMIWDSRLIKENVANIGADRLEFDHKFAASLEDVMTTDDGFKFRDSKGKSVVLLLGLGFFKLGITDEEYVALILHEWGHCIEQMIMNVNAEIYCEYKRGLIEDAIKIIDFVSLKDSVLDPGKVVSNFLAIFPNLFTLIFDEVKGLKKLEKQADKNPNKTGELLAKKLMGEFDRNDIIKETKDQRFFTINRMVRSRPKKFKESMMKIVYVPLTYIFKSFMRLAWVFFIPFKMILDPKNKVIALNKKFLSKEVRYEQFADYVATSYGYGRYLTSVFIKSTKMTNEDGQNLYLFNFLHYVPIINLVIAYGNYVDEKCSNLLAGYPSTIQRIEGIYKALDYELQTNSKNLSPTTQETIRLEMEELKRQHEMYKKKKGARYFVTRIFYKITKRSIETYKDKSTMYDNVLSKMDEITNENSKELGYSSKDLQETEMRLVQLEESAESFMSSEDLKMLQLTNIKVK